MDKHCGSCKYLRTVAVDDKKLGLRYEFLCRHTNKVIDPIAGGTDCTTYEFVWGGLDDGVDDLLDSGN